MKIPTRKKQTSNKTDYTDLSLGLVKRILGFWDGYVEITAEKQWIELFGKRTKEYRQIFTRVSYYNYMRTSHWNPYYYPFRLPPFVKVTAIKAKTAGDPWLSNWKKLRDIDLFINFPHVECGKTSEWKKRTNYIINEMKAWKNLRSVSLYTCELYALHRHIHKLELITSLNLEIVDRNSLSEQKRFQWDELFKHMIKLRALKRLTLTFIPPKNTFSLPPSLKFLHLLYFASGEEFFIRAPPLQVLVFSQLYSRTAFDKDVQQLIECTDTSSLKRIEIYYKKMNDVRKFENLEKVVTVEKINK
jgi:hypothetical protein